MKIFGVEKFKGLLLAGSFTVFADYVVRLSDSIIAGNFLGANALAGINLIGPCLSAISFLSGLISSGMATNYSIAMGRCDRLRARQFFMQAIWTSLLFGGILSGLFFFGDEHFLEFLGASAEITEYARRYLVWTWPLAILEAVETSFIAIGYADGDSRLCSLSYIVIFVSNFITSIVGVKLGLGTAGCAIGSLVSEVLGILIISLHFMKKSNTVKIVKHFSITDTITIVKTSFGDAAAFLCDGLLFLFVNKFVIVKFGSEYLPVIGVAVALWGFLEFFNGIGIAIQPIVTVYHGENNTRSIRTVMNSAMRVAVCEGIVFMIIFGGFPQIVVKMVGLSDSALVLESCAAIRWMCWGFLALAFAGLFNSYYMFIEHSMLAGLITFLCYLIMPILAVFVMAMVGIRGVWIGLGMGPFLGLVVFLMIILIRYGRAMFPLLLSRARDDALYVFNLVLDEFSIVATSRQAAAALSEKIDSEGMIVKVSLMIEEVLMVVKERNCGKRVLAEVTLDLNDGVLLTMRDDGEIFDITDADQQISSLRSFLVASMMLMHDGRMNLVTTGFNRNVFKF